MTEILTESFCERCGTRYTFESPRPKLRLKGVKVVSRGLKNFVLSDTTSMDEAMAAARSETDREVTTYQLDAFHKTFNFCMQCRQYTCPNCWNEAEARCLTCAPHLGHEVLPAPFPDMPANGVMFADDPSGGALLVDGTNGSNGTNGTNGFHSADQAGFEPPDADFDVAARLDALTMIAAPAAAPAPVPPADVVAVEPAVPEPEAVVAPKSELAEPEAAAERETIVAAEPGVAEAEAVVAPEPEAAVVPPEALVVGEPQAAAAEPEVAIVAEPEAVDAEPEVAIVANPEDTIAAVAEPEAVVAVAAEPEAVVAEPEVARVAEPEAVVAAEPEVAIVAEPEVVVAAEPEVAIVAEPEAVLAAEPEVAAVAEPEVVEAPEHEHDAPKIGALGAAALLVADQASDQTAPPAEAPPSGFMAMFGRFRPGQNLDAELDAYEREHAAAAAATTAAIVTEPAAAEAAVELGAPEAEPVAQAEVSAEPEVVAPAPAEASTPEVVSAEPVEAADTHIPEIVAAAAVLHEPAETQVVAEPEPVAATAQPEPEPVATDVIAQPTWQMVAPDPTPTPPVAPTPPAPDPAAGPQWPTRPAWLGSAPSVGLPFLGRSAKPQGGVEALWAESNREVANPPSAAKPAAVQPCVSCGLSLSGTARFCRRCGTAQPS